MTDNTSYYAGNYGRGIVITCILNEGAPTVTGRTYDELGENAKGIVYASELTENDSVAIANDSSVTFDDCNGIPVVEKPSNGEQLVVGKIVGTPRIVKTPPNSAAADTLSERISGGYYRIANVELMAGITSIQKATVMCDGSNATVPGDGTTLKLNITSEFDSDRFDDGNNTMQLDTVASGGTGLIPFHYVPAGTDGDTYSCLVGVTGLITAVTGA